MDQNILLFYIFLSPSLSLSLMEQIFKELYISRKSNNMEQIFKELYTSRTINIMEQIFKELYTGQILILLYKVVRIFMKLMISITTEPIKFFILGRLHIGPWSIKHFSNFHSSAIWPKI